MVNNFIRLFIAVCSILQFVALSQNDPQELERERIRWNKSLTKDSAYRFNKNPNTLLVETVKGKRPGKALDIGMGQGRNTIFLAQKGWDVTGADIADEAIAFAKNRAVKEKLRINTELVSMEKFNYGINTWDLVVHVYEGCLEDESITSKILKSLKPGGLFVFEFFHRDAGVEMNRPDFGCKTNTVKAAIEKTGGFKILTYTEAIDTADFSQRITKLIKLVAVKK